MIFFNHFQQRNHRNLEEVGLVVERGVGVPHRGRKRDRESVRVSRYIKEDHCLIDLLGM